MLHGDTERRVSTANYFFNAASQSEMIQIQTKQEHDHSLAAMTARIA